MSEENLSIREKIDKIIYEHCETRPFETPKAIEMNRQTSLKLSQECNEMTLNPLVHVNNITIYKGLEVCINNSLKDDEIVIKWEKKEEMNDGLKTLEEIFHKSENASVSIEQFKNILRKEAIKWIKELSKGGFNRNPQIRFNKGRVDTSEVFEAIFSMETDIVVRWIKHFFNISDEDLEKVKEDE